MRDDAIDPIRPTAAWMPKAVLLTIVGNNSTTRTFKAFHADTDTAAKTHENATTPGKRQRYSEQQMNGEELCSKGGHDSSEQHAQHAPPIHPLFRKHKPYHPP
jgi:hypothetical protein